MTKQDRIEKNKLNIKRVVYDLGVIFNRSSQIEELFVGVKEEVEILLWYIKNEKLTKNMLLDKRFEICYEAEINDLNDELANFPTLTALKTDVIEAIGRLRPLLAKKIYKVLVINKYSDFRFNEARECIKCLLATVTYYFDKLEYKNINKLICGEVEYVIELIEETIKERKKLASLFNGIEKYSREQVSKK